MRDYGARPESGDTEGRGACVVSGEPLCWMGYVTLGSPVSGNTKHEARRVTGMRAVCGLTRRGSRSADSDIDLGSGGPEEDAVRL